MMISLYASLKYVGFRETRVGYKIARGSFCSVPCVARRSPLIRKHPGVK